MVARVRDRSGFPELQVVRQSSVVGDATLLPAVERIALILMSKGGTIGDITPGDCLELLKLSRQVSSPVRSNRHSPFFYQLLHSIGIFPGGHHQPKGQNRQT